MSLSTLRPPDKPVLSLPLEHFDLEKGSLKLCTS